MMRTPRFLHAASLLGAAVATAALFAPRDAKAQADTNPALPNVLLLVDSSGSMEYVPGLDPNTQQPRLPVCNPGNPGATNEQSRWISLAAVLTGEPVNYSCFAQPRNGLAFLNEFKIGGITNPIDNGYYLPYNRIVSNDCVMGPDLTVWPPATGGQAFEFPANSLKKHSWTAAGTTCGSFLQLSDGILDAFRESIRFGLMTFDTETGPGTGLTPPKALNTGTALSGAWSYYPGWETNAPTYAKGLPVGCAVPQEMEVGARNPSAPPWEGRMVGFGDPFATPAQVAARNDKIQQVLLSTRPYGATPIAGLMSDAQQLLWYDTMVDPTDNTPFGPTGDAYASCRDNYVILFTDGFPNLDLRPSCAGSPQQSVCPWAPGGVCPAGQCPYKTPAEVAYDLAHPPAGKPKILTFVVPFATSMAGPVGNQVDCKTLDPNGPSCVAPSNEGIKACCELHKIAFNGDTGKALFTNDKDELRFTLGQIFNVIGKKATTRTLPVFGSGGNGNYQFFSSFKVQSAGLWSGILERSRQVCVGSTPGPQQAPIQAEGDLFHENIKLNDPANPRRFYTVDPNGSAPNPQGTIRSITTPFAGAAALGVDGLGNYAGAQVNGTGDSACTGACPLFRPETLQVISGGTSTCTTAAEILTPTQCRDRVIKFNLGMPTGKPLATRETTPFGAIYHSTPVISEPPSDFVRDPAYQRFRELYRTRATVLYTATTDGQLHAFKVTTNNASPPNDKFLNQNNELFSFLPPAVLPGLKNLYPGVQQNLLDGRLTLRDAVLSRDASQALAADINGAGAQWGTYLVAGFGPFIGGYYALDVTKPEKTSADPTSGPRFLWQLTTDQNGAQLFGKKGNAAVATVRMNINANPTEVSVAILPGGDDDPLANPATCTTAVGTFNMMVGETPRSDTRCYSSTSPARSVTIVRLDNGQVLRRFQSGTALSANGTLTSLTTQVAPLAPVTGIPVPYPNRPGAVSSRAYVGDKEGRIWRLDFSNPDPAQWSMKIAWDGFPTSKAALYSTTGGQPIQGAPAVTVNSLGEPIVVFSTGDQDGLTATPNLRNVAWAFKEYQDAVGAVLTQKVWRLGFGDEAVTLPQNVPKSWTNGIRVTGPIRIFNGGAYFTTFTPVPAGGNVCALGDSSVWGVSVLLPETNPQFGVMDAAFTPAIYYAGRIVFGVGITRTASCFTTVSTPDPFGAGSLLTPDQATEPSYQLVVQYGSSVGNPAAGFETKFERTVRQPPARFARMGSWTFVGD